MSEIRMNTICPKCGHPEATVIALGFVSHIIRCVKCGYVRSLS